MVGNDELAMYSSSRRKPIERKKWWREVNDRVEGIEREEEGIRGGRLYV